MTSCFPKSTKFAPFCAETFFIFVPTSTQLFKLFPKKVGEKGEALAEKENFHSKRSQEEVEHCGKKTEFHHGHAALLIALLCSQPICFHASKRKLPLNVYF